MDEEGYDLRWDLRRVTQVGDVHPGVKFVGSAWYERDFWQCHEADDTGKEVRNGRRYTVRPYIFQEMNVFRIFRLPSRREDREYHFRGRDAGYDGRWNLWHDTFKRGLFYYGVGILRRMGLGLV